MFFVVFAVLLTVNIAAQDTVVPLRAMALFWCAGFSIALLVIGIQASRPLWMGGVIMIAAAVIASLTPAWFDGILALGGRSASSAPASLSPWKRPMDELLLSKVRLAIIAQLVPVEWVTFTELQKSIAVTNGNLGAHLAKLVEGGYVKEEKRFEGRRPQSRYRLCRARARRHCWLASPSCRPWWNQGDRVRTGAWVP